MCQGQLGIPLPLDTLQWKEKNKVNRIHYNKRSRLRYNKMMRVQRTATFSQGVKFESMAEVAFEFHLEG